MVELKDIDKALAAFYWKISKKSAESLHIVM